MGTTFSQSLNIENRQIKKEHLTTQSRITAGHHNDRGSGKCAVERKYSRNPNDYRDCHISGSCAQEMEILLRKAACHKDRPAYVAQT